jgi:hypothetical protein
MNSSFVQERAAALAARLVREAESDEERVRRAFLLCFGHGPMEEEERRCVEFLRLDATPLAEGAEMENPQLFSFCQALLSTAEFRNVD